MNRYLVPSLLALSFLAPSASAVEQTVVVPLLDCYVTVAVTDVALLLSNPPQLRVSGPTGAWTDCP